MNMGGPYICSVYLGDKFIANKCIFGNFIYSEALDAIFFVRARIKWVFTICFYSIKNDQLYEFAKGFDIVFIKQFTHTHLLEIYHAFHDKLPERKDVFDIDEEPFIDINISDYEKSND